MEKGIYIEAVPAALGQWHSYLVYRDGEGGERIIRGGPGKPIGVPDTRETRFIASGMGRNMEIEIDVPIEESKDAYGPTEIPGSRPSRKLDLNGRDVDLIWKSMIGEAQSLKSMNLEYSTIPNTQNSNSVVRAIMRKSGIDYRRNKIPGIPTHKLLGIKNGLIRPDVDEDETDQPNQNAPRDSRMLPPQTFQRTNPTPVETAPLNPVSRALLERTRALGQSPGEIMAKGVARVTEPEVRNIVGHPDYWPSIKRKLRPAAQSLPDFAGAWFDRAYNDLPPGAAPRIPASALPALSPDGTSVRDGLQRVASVLGQGVNEPAAPTPFGADLTKPVQALQRTLNNVAGDGFAAPLKEDGVLGPKTNDRLRDVLTFSGRAPVLTGLQPVFGTA